MPHLAEFPDGLSQWCLRSALTSPGDVAAFGAVDRRCRSALLGDATAIWAGVAGTLIPLPELAVLSAANGASEGSESWVSCVKACHRPQGLRQCSLEETGKLLQQRRRGLCRSGHAACTLGSGLVVALHGLGPWGLHHDAAQPLVLDLARMQWLEVEEAVSASGEFPSPRLRATLTALSDNSAALFGGVGVNGEFLGDVWLMQADRTATGGVRVQWWGQPPGGIETSGHQPAPRAHHASVALHGGLQLCVLGGSSAHCPALPVEIEVLDLASRRWEQPQQTGLFPPPRTMHLASVYNDPGTGRSQRIFVIGGVAETRLGASCHGAAPVFSLDLEAMSWERLPPDPLAPPLTTRGAGCALGGGRWLLVLGGDTGGRFSREPRLFDQCNARWRAAGLVGSDEEILCAGHSLSSGVLLGGYGLNAQGQVTVPVARFHLVSLDGSVGNPGAPLEDVSAPRRERLRKAPAWFRR